MTTARTRTRGTSSIIPPLSRHYPPNVPVPHPPRSSTAEAACLATSARHSGRATPEEAETTINSPLAAPPRASPWHSQRWRWRATPVPSRSAAAAAESLGGSWSATGTNTWPAHRRPEAVTAPPCARRSAGSRCHPASRRLAQSRTHRQTQRLCAVLFHTPHARQRPTPPTRPPCGGSRSVRPPEPPTRRPRRRPRWRQAPELGGDGGGIGRQHSGTGVWRRHQRGKDRVCWLAASGTDTALVGCRKWAVDSSPRARRNVSGRRQRASRRQTQRRTPPLKSAPPKRLLPRPPHASAVDAAGPLQFARPAGRVATQAAETPSTSPPAAQPRLSSQWRQRCR